MPRPIPGARVCPGCRQERHPTHFIPDSRVCAVCRECGPKYPVEEEPAVKPKTPTKECPWCHAPKTNVSEHKKVCKAKPADGGAPKEPGDRPQVRATGRRTGCQVCGLNVAERDLVATAIRGGLSFDNAVGFVRQARAAFGR